MLAFLARSAKTGKAGPCSGAERVELETLLRGDDRAVLEVLRWETEALLLRVRIVTEAVRAGRRTETPA